MEIQLSFLPIKLRRKKKAHISLVCCSVITLLNVSAFCGAALLGHWTGFWPKCVSCRQVAHRDLVLVLCSSGRSCGWKAECGRVLPACAFWRLRGALSLCLSQGSLPPIVLSHLQKQKQKTPTILKFKLKKKNPYYFIINLFPDFSSGARRKESCKL